MPDSDSIFKERTKEQTLAEHDRLSNLYSTNRFSFELERKHLIRDFLENVPCPEMRARIEDFQNELDRVLKGAGSEHNRLVMMQMLFWDRVNIDLIPALNALSREPATGDAKKTESNKPHFELPESSHTRCKAQLKLLQTSKG